ncbi:MAG: DUF2189 domain-containing protein [Burkholderiales bacterium]|nr:DUF2189 domain-containing protein [Burkholderiales bacterium]
MTDEGRVTDPHRSGGGGDEPASPFPEIRTVGLGAPVRWLRAGWRDLRAAPVPSLFYGVVLAAMGFALAHAPGSGAIELALATGFLLVGPFLLMGLYDIAQRVARGEAVMIAPTTTAWKANVQSIGFYAIILALLLAVWIRISIVLVALFFEGTVPSTAALAADALRDPETLTFVLAYAAAGFGFALFVFATSVVTLPMLYDRPQMDSLTAMITSFNALRMNFWPMLAWGATIVALTGLGFATYYVGLIIALPLVGLATWHAYREVVAPADARCEEKP